jgi:hypothetical protein
MINGEEVPRELWSYVRPKVATDECPIVVSLHWSLQGGGRGGSGGGLKAVVGIVAALALVVITAGIAAGAIPFLAGGLSATGGLFGAGSISAAVLAGAVGLVGSLAISALTAPPSQGPGGQGSAGLIDDSNTDQKESAGAQGNALEPGGAVPRVIGHRKVYPPFACEPLVELVERDEFVEAVYVLNGPHKIEDIRLDGVPITEANDVTYELREGWEDDLPLTSITRHGRTAQPGIEMSVHQVFPTAQSTLLNQGSPRLSCPVWHGVTTRNAPDEIWIHLALPSGISSAGGGTELGIPFRMRMRRKGAGDWINFPEFHISDATISQLRREVRIRWRSAESIQSVPATGGFIWAGQGINLTGFDGDTSNADTIWNAHSHFVQSSGGHLYSGVESATILKNINLFYNRVEFYLDEAVFPKGIYEVQLKRGSIYTSSSFTKSSYLYAGSYLNSNFFTWYLSGSTATASGNRANIADRVGMVRVISVWNQAPIQTKRWATIAIKARNRSISRLSIIASGYVPDWIGDTTSATVVNGNDDYTKLLLHFENVAGTAVFRDSSLEQHGDATVGGNAVLSSAQVKFGSTSALFDGSGDYIQYANSQHWDFENDFTIDGWVRLSSYASAGNQSTIASHTGSSDYWALWVNETGLPWFRFQIDSVNYDAGGGNITASAWHHLAVVRSNGVISVYADGSLVGSTVSIAGSPATSDPLFIGAFGGSSHFLNGHIDEFRISKGIARWTANFTPPNEEYYGGAWRNWTTTSNPAPHYVDILSGQENLDPLPDDLRGDEELLEWRQLCEENKWQCDAIIDDMRTQDALGLLASCGYAKPYQSDQYSVTIDKDRTNEVPIQVFSRINSANFRFERAFARVPDGFVVTFRDDSQDDDRSQLIVYQRNRTLTTTGLLEQVSFDGLTEESSVRARAQFDLDQANSRSTFYYLDADIESLVCRKGSLVAVQNDILSSHAGDAHVVSRILGSPSTIITGLNLDAELPITNEVDMHAITDMHAVADMHLVGITTGVAIRRTDGTISTHGLSNVTGNTSQITFTTPIDPDPGTILGYNDTNKEYGCIVVSGQLDSEYRRLLVASINAVKDLKAGILLVDEAPDLVRYNRSVLLMHFEAASTSTSFVDSSFRQHGTAAIFGDPQMSSSVAKFGSTSGEFDGTLDRLEFPYHTDWEFSDGDFTVDWWEYRTTTPVASASMPVLIRDSTATTYQAFLIGYPESSVNKFYASSTGTSWDAVSSMSLGSIDQNTWNHFAVVRKGVNFYGFKNGVLQGTAVSSLSLVSSTGPLSVGYWNFGGGSYFTGYLDELRVTKGLARWTENFTPPTSAYTG